MSDTTRESTDRARHAANGTHSGVQVAEPAQSSLIYTSPPATANACEAACDPSCTGCGSCYETCDGLPMAEAMQCQEGCLAGEQCGATLLPTKAGGQGPPPYAHGVGGYFGLYGTGQFDGQNSGHDFLGTVSLPCPLRAVSGMQQSKPAAAV